MSDQPTLSVISSADAAPPAAAGEASQAPDATDAPAAPRRDLLVGLFGGALAGFLMSRPAGATYPTYDSAANLKLMDAAVTEGNILTCLNNQLSRFTELTQSVGDTGITWNEPPPTWTDSAGGGLEGTVTAVSESTQKSGFGMLWDGVKEVGSAVGRGADYAMKGVGSLLRALNPMNLLGNGNGQSLLFAGAQPAFDGMDRVPDADLLSSPADARTYSRDTLGPDGVISGGQSWDTLGYPDKQRIADRRIVESNNAALDGHGTSLFHGQAAARTGDRTQRISGEINGAQTLRQQEYATGQTLVSILEETAAVRGLLAAMLRLQSADRLNLQSLDVAPTRIINGALEPRDGEPGPGLGEPAIEMLLRRLAGGSLDDLEAAKARLARVPQEVVTPSAYV